MRNLNIRNLSFDTATVEAVWRKGSPIFGLSPDTDRKDTCGAHMKRSEYGNTNSMYGWEIDHIKPKVHGGGDELYNLQPLQWENNRSKGDSFPAYTYNYCIIRA